MQIIDALIPEMFGGSLHIEALTFKFGKIINRLGDIRVYDLFLIRDVGSGV